MNFEEMNVYELCRIKAMRQGDNNCRSAAVVGVTIGFVCNVGR